MEEDIVDRLVRTNHLIDMRGKKYNRLTAVEYVGSSPNNGALWRFECDCGNKNFITSGSAVRRGTTKSCGCLNQEKRKSRKKHGMIGTPIYNCWIHMHQRCQNPDCEEYVNYGGRGISICSEWYDFQNFYEWAKSSGYSSDLTIDRIDNNGNYEPDNCRWTTMEVQENNKRNNHFIKYQGESMTISQCAKKAGVSRNALNYRLMKGMTADEAVAEIKDKEANPEKYDRHRYVTYKGNKMTITECAKQLGISKRQLTYYVVQKGMSADKAVEYIQFLEAS